VTNTSRMPIRVTRCSQTGIGAIHCENDFRLNDLNNESANSNERKQQGRVYAPQGGRGTEGFS